MDEQGLGAGAIEHIVPLTGGSQNVIVRFVRDGRPYGHPVVRSRFGYLCVEGMVFGCEEQVDAETGEVFAGGKPVVPTHYKSPSNGDCLEVEHPSDWPIPEDEDA